MMQDGAPFFTVFTPTYNRADLLPRVFESLTQQSFRNFEWLIIDDGSTDNTRAVVDEFIAGEPGFAITYIHKTNGGKHSAYPVAVENARGYALVTLDSDDWLLAAALENLHKRWQSLDNQEQFVGVCGLFQYQDGAVVGSQFPRDPFISNAVTMRFIGKTSGDKIGFNRLDVLRQFPFPELGERFTPESIVWNRISQNYHTAFVNEVIGVKDYQEGGLSDGSDTLSIRFPRGYYVLHSELVNGKYSIGLKNLLRSMITAQKCSWYGYSKPFIPKGVFNKLLALGAMPLVLAAFVRDYFRLRKAEKS